MNIIARIGTILSWPETRGVPPFEAYYFVATFDVYFWYAGMRHSKRFENQIFKTNIGIPDIGQEIEISFNETTGEINLVN